MVTWNLNIARSDFDEKEYRVDLRRKDIIKEIKNIGFIRGIYRLRVIFICV